VEVQGETGEGGARVGVLKKQGYGGRAGRRQGRGWGGRALGGAKRRFQKSVTFN